MCWNRFKQEHNLSIGLKLLVLTAGMAFLCGFSFSDHHKLTQEIKAQLRRITEKTPSAKLRNEWRMRRDEASSALEKAELVQASKYCPEKRDESVALYKKARYYASKRSYKKAIFLAKKTTESAKKMYITSKAFLLQQKAGLARQYKRLRARADELAGSIPPDAAALEIRASRISLELENARLAIDLTQFETARKALPGIKTEMDRLDRQIRAYKKANPPPDDDDT